MPSNNKNQSGVALLIFIILVALAAITYYFSTLSSAELKINRQQQTRLILKQAKQALIAYAITHVDMPSSNPPYNNYGEYGDLPCPDFASSGTEGNGDAVGACGGSAKAVEIGYLPWRSLGIDALKDSSGTCLFYAVSPGYKNSSANVMLNEDSNGLIQIVDNTGTPVEGATADTRPVAVVLAAGTALANQNRTPNTTSICGEDYNNLAAYLDNDGTTDNSLATTADQIKKFVSVSPGSENKPQPVNDQLITISREDIWKAILRRRDFKTKINNLTQALALCVAKYTADSGNTGRRLPWPAPLDLAMAPADYKGNKSYDDVGGLYAGRFPYKVDDSNAKTGVVELNDVIFNTPGCDSLMLADGTIANLDPNSKSEYNRLWQNWKDHFFYAISNVYEPVSGASTETQCNPFPIPSLNVCITVKDNAGVVRPYAGIVFYSGSRLAGQLRDAPPPTVDADEKAVISNYLENGNDGIFAGATGTKADTYHTNGTDPTTENDVMWCIKDKAPGFPLDVVQC